MDTSVMLRNRVEIINDAVRMKKRPERVPFIATDGFWRYHDFGLKLSEALLDYQVIEDTTIQFQQRYQVDSFLDIGDRNPIQVTTSLGNHEYKFDDTNNTLSVQEQCFFTPDDYDAFALDPVKTLWENILPRKYSLLNEATSVETLGNTLGKFLEWAQNMGKIKERLAKECGVPALYPDNGSIVIGFEVLYSFLRGMKGLSSDIRRCPEKVIDFTEVYHAAFARPALAGIQLNETNNTAFTKFSALLSHNMLSPKQFGKFVWPYLKEITNRIVETDNTLVMLSEGSIKHITEYLQELPKGHFCVYVESDDIFETRKRLPNLCLWGGIPLPILSMGTKDECVDYVKRVIDEVGCDGGLILSPNKFTSSPRDCNRENYQAVSEFVHNYN